MRRMKMFSILIYLFLNSCGALNGEPLSLLSIRNACPYRIFIGYKDRHGQRQCDFLNSKSDRILSIRLDNVNALTVYHLDAANTSFQVFCKDAFFYITENFCQDVLAVPLWRLPLKVLSIEIFEPSIAHDTVVRGIRLFKEL